LGPLAQLGPVEPGTCWAHWPSWAWDALGPLVQLGPGPLGPLAQLGLGFIWAYWPTSYRYTSILQVYRHPAGLLAYILQVYKHPTGIQTSCRFTTILQVNNHPIGIHTSYGYTDMLQEYRHPAGIQASCRYIGIRQVRSHPIYYPSVTLTRHSLSIAYFSLLCSLCLLSFVCFASLPARCVLFS